MSDPVSLPLIDYATVHALLVVALTGVPSPVTEVHKEQHTGTEHWTVDLGEPAMLARGYRGPAAHALDEDSLAAAVAHLARIRDAAEEARAAVERHLEFRKSL